MSSFSFGGCGNTELRSPDDAPISQCHCGSNSSLWLEVNHIHFPIIRGNVPTAENIRKHSEGEKNNKHFWCLSYGANDANANDVSLNLWNLTWKRSVDKTNTQFLFERWIKKIYLSMGKIWRYKSFFLTVLFKF